MSNVTIKDVRAIATHPGTVNLVAVKVETSEPGLYGVGCATFTQRSEAVVTAINTYIKPLCVGKPVDNIEDMWQFLMGSSYWRNGPVLNNAISGVDEALWDIKGKMANMPVYQLLGGKCREGAPVYRHCDGASPEEVAENVQKYMEEGYRHVRVQQGVYGGNMNGSQEDMFDKIGKSAATGFHSPEGAPNGAYFDPKAYMRRTLKLFDYLRSKLGFEIELMHDVHERLSPIDGVSFAREVEQYKLFFLEDLFSPEQSQWFRQVRNVCATPIAMGELFNNPLEWRDLVADQMIDFIRIHVSQIGGISAAQKVANFCEPFGIRTAWHGPNDITPIGVAAHLAVDLSVSNFGIQEFAGFTEAEKEVFPGCPEVRNGFLYANEKPGLGIDIDEEAAARYPARYHDNGWLWARLPDGTSVRA